MAARTYQVELTRAELELLLRATYTGNAETYCEDRRQSCAAARIRQKVSDKLGEIDTAQAAA